ncbi:putative phthalate 4,5-dioxygenase domain protein [Mycobacterium avium MAV_120809_2495]|nr:putative phthalate 4,5-dioxygenase domain protein [Mycobacterium avium MAV_120809_2495]
MAQAIWESIPADLYGRRKRDRMYTALYGVGALFGGWRRRRGGRPRGWLRCGGPPPRWSPNVRSSHPTWSP